MAKHKIFLKQYDEIINQYTNQKISAKNIAITYKVTSETIHRILRNKNIPSFRSPGKRSKGLNENYFEKIDTEEKAYFLGFFYADGSLNLERNSFDIGLNEKDKDILEKFRKLLGITTDLSFRPAKITEFRGRKIKSGNVYRLTFHNNKIVSDLCKMGLHNNKSFDLDFPDLEEHLKIHFIRGLFDGDGSIYKGKDGNYGFSILATFNINKYIQNFFKEKYALSLPLYRLKRYARELTDLRVVANLKVLQITDILYKNSTIHLERKYLKYLDLKNQVLQKQIDDTINWPKTPMTRQQLAINLNMKSRTVCYQLNLALKKGEIQKFDHIYNKNHLAIDRFIAV